MNRSLTVAHGAVAYAAFLVAIGYAVGFTGDIAVPRTVDAGLPAPTGEAVAVDVVLLGLFAVQHSVMARPGFKRRWTRLVPEPVERSTYVLASSLLLFLLYWQWRPLPAIIWDVTWPAGRVALRALFWLGWATVLASTFMIDHFALFGLRQVHAAWQGKPYSEAGFRTVALYRVVRHPIMVGFVIAFWSAPTMTAGHLLFACATTGYILVAVQFEERDLAAMLGEDYREYRRRVPMFVPGLHRGAGTAAPRTPSPTS